MTTVARDVTGPPLRRPTGSGRAGQGDRWPGEARRAGLAAAAVEAVAYADVFDWPLRPPEIHCHLPRRATLAEVQEALASLGAARRLAFRDGFVTLPGRAALVEARLRREAASRALWPRAIRWAGAVAGLPFVRMVAITGSLAVDAAEEGADVDLMVVTEDGRLWLCRALAMGIVRAARLFGVRLCPNYLVTESNLRIDDRTLFTAHELAQMVPVRGTSTYRALLLENAWLDDFLPNGASRPAVLSDSPGRLAGALRRLAEVALRSRLGDRLERWEMERKVLYLGSVARSAETRYDATCCKGHADEHGRRTLDAFGARLARLAEVS